MTINLAPAGDLKHSCLMYKLLIQKIAAGEFVAAMPKGVPQLPDAQLCKYIIWIQEGAK